MVAPVWTPDRPEVMRRTSIPAVLRDWNPKSLAGLTALRCLPYLPVDLALELKERLASAVVLESVLSMRHFDARGRLVHDYGIVGRKMVTTAGVGFLVDAFANGVELENMKYHGIGTGGAAEATGNTTLTTELTTQYIADNTRATGSTTENGANVYRTVGTNQVDSAVAITEHGIFSAATSGTGVLLDRTLFSVINLASNESLESTYDLTFTAGS
jgi:hypothetical protein